MKVKPKQGQQVYVVHRKRRHGGGGQSHMDVLRVGTKYCYLLIHGREHPFDWRTGFSVHKESNARANGFGFDVYDSQDDYDKQQRAISQARRLQKRMVGAFGQVKFLAAECVDKIHAVLDEFGIETGGDA